MHVLELKSVEVVAKVNALAAHLIAYSGAPGVHRLFHPEVIHYAHYPVQLLECFSLPLRVLSEFVEAQSLVALAPHLAVLAIFSATLFEQPDLEHLILELSLYALLESVDLAAGHFDTLRVLAALLELHEGLLELLVFLAFFISVNEFFESALSMLDLALLEPVQRVLLVVVN